MNISQQSSVGNLADLKEGEILLPDYIIRQQNGIYINLQLFPVGGGFEKFIDRLFGEGLRFVCLNYQMLMDLLYDYDSILNTCGIESKIKLADDIIPFPANRKILYKGVKLDPEFRNAEYFFEPAEIEVETDVPVYSEDGTDGVRHLVNLERKTELRPTSLDVDEFIADMWLKGVRFGIDVGAVTDTISRREPVRMKIAEQLDATEGSDAEIEEASDVLHRDNAPKILPNGKADLRRFKNRFPQIEAGALLLRKINRVPGKHGVKINGAWLEAAIPKDVDLQALAGMGTRVEIRQGGEFIVSTRSGFLALDVETNHIDITEKIENKTGVSLKTTGDLSLAGKEFIEHGEVQEGRFVEGANMTFRSDVYGSVVSKGGFILLEQSLSNGSAKSVGGDISSSGRVFNSVIDARDGRVSIKYAEASLILAKSVVVDHAINCEIIAENIAVGAAEGCGIAGKYVKVSESKSNRGKENIIAIVLPDLSVFETQIRQVNKAILNCKQIIKSKDIEISKIASNEDVAKYLALAVSVKQSTVKLTAAQQENWKRMTSKFAKIDSALEMFNLEKQEQIKRLLAFQQEISYLIEGREKTGKGIQCKIPQVSGDTLVRTMTVYDGIHGLHKLSAGEIKVKLREQGLPQDRLFFDEEGNLDWEYKLDEIDL